MNLNDDPEAGLARPLDNRTLWEQVRDRMREDILAVLGHVWYSTLVAWSSGRIDFDQVTAELDRAVRVLVEPYERRDGHSLGA